MAKRIARVGVGGPVGSGKTALIESVVPPLIADGYKIIVVTNDIVTVEDALHVKRTLAGILEPDRVQGVETGACPHTAVREDPTMNLAFLEEMETRFPDSDPLFFETGVGNLTLPFGPALLDSSTQ